MARLAINGGPKAHEGGWPPWPVYDEREIEAVTRVIKSRQWGIGGGYVAEFERTFAEFQDAQFCTCVTSGTHAIELCLCTLGIGAGDEVIVPPYTFIATASSVLAVNAIPIFADIDPDTFCIDPAEIERKITDKTRAIIPVHIGGTPCDMDAIMDIAQRHGLFVIEDACQAHGAEYKGRRVGAIGHMGAFSFQVSKNIPAGEGGAVTTNTREYAERAWSIHNVGRVPDGAWYEHRVMGWNLRMTQFQGAILVCQIERTEEQMAQRARGAGTLRRQLEEVPGLRLTAVTPGGRSPYHLAMLRYDAASFGGLPRAQFIRAMNAEGIPMSSGYVPLYRSGVFLQGIDHTKCPMACPFYGRTVEYAQTHCPVCEKVCDETGLWLSQNMLFAEEEVIGHIAEAALKVQENVGELVESVEAR